MKIGRFLGAMPLTALAALSWKASLSPADECCGGDGTTHALNGIIFGAAALFLAGLALAVAFALRPPQLPSRHLTRTDDLARIRLREELKDLFE